VHNREHPDMPRLMPTLGTLHLARHQKVRLSRLAAPCAFSVGAEEQLSGLILIARADGEIRTPGPLFTNKLLYRDRVAEINSSGLFAMSLLERG